MIGSRAVMILRLCVPQTPASDGHATTSMSCKTLLWLRRRRRESSGGTWRRYFRYEESTMPASWAQLEPAKILGRDERSVFKFEGFGHYGEAIGSGQNYWPSVVFPRAISAISAASANMKWWPDG